MNVERQPISHYMTDEREIMRKSFTGVLDAFTELTDDKIMTADELFRYVIHFVESAAETEMSDDQKTNTLLRFKEHIDQRLLDSTI